MANELKDLIWSCLNGRHYNSYFELNKGREIPIPREEYKVDLTSIYNKLNCCGHKLTIKEWEEVQMRGDFTCRHFTQILCPECDKVYFERMYDPEYDKFEVNISLEYYDTAKNRIKRLKNERDKLVSDYIKRKKDFANYL
jgi:uncharacterized C2H2 Zn-finger protein